MAFSDLADLVQLACKDTFGQIVEYRPTVGDAVSITAVFDRVWTEVEPASGLAVSTNDPTLGLDLSDLSAAPAQGDNVVISGTDLYEIVDYQEDGHGWVVLKLHRNGNA